MNTTHLSKLVGIGLMAVLLVGCSTVMAAKQPPKKDLKLLNPGTPRMLLVAEYGAPILTETKDGKKVDIYSFTQGYSKTAKVGRAFLHGVGDLLTLGAWEVVGTPTEAIFSGQDMVVEVTYDAGDKVEKAVMLKKK